MPATDQGVSHARYAVIPRTLIFLTSGERLLLLQGASHKRLWANRYNGVGGHIERGEDVLNAARRELLEEIGLVVPDLWLAGVITVDACPDLGICVFVLRGECAHTDVLPSEEGNLEWVHRSELLQLPLVEDLPIILPRLLELQPGDPPFFAHSAYDPQGKMIVTFG